MERWVSEVNAGWGLTVKTTQQLCDIQTPYQHIEIFETVNLGHLMMLDGIVQLSSYDEFAYHEMMANLPFYLDTDACMPDSFPHDMGKEASR